jgi:ATP-dependent Zn protease
LISDFATTRYDLPNVVVGSRPKMQNTAPTQRKSTAYHEAGHAVIGRVLGLICGAATIIPDVENNQAGWAIIEDPWMIIADWEARGRYRDVRTVYRGRILANMAGAETEKEIFGRCHGGDDDDQYRISLMLEEADLDKEWERHQPRMRAITQQLVRRHRTKIERVAQALLRHGKLQADEIDALLAE